MRPIQLPNTDNTATMIAECTLMYSYRNVVAQIKRRGWTITRAKGSHAVTMAKRVAIPEWAEHATPEAIALLCHELVHVLQWDRGEWSFVAQYLRWSKRLRLECDAYYTQGYALAVLGVSEDDVGAILRHMDGSGYSIWPHRRLEAACRFSEAMRAGYDAGKVGQ